MYWPVLIRGGVGGASVHFYDKLAQQLFKIDDLLFLLEKVLIRTVPLMDHHLKPSLLQNSAYSNALRPAATTADFYLHYSASMIMTAVLRRGISFDGQR